MVYMKGHPQARWGCRVSRSLENPPSSPGTLEVPLCSCWGLELVYPLPPLQAGLIPGRAEEGWACWGRVCALGRGVQRARRGWGTQAWACAFCSPASCPGLPAAQLRGRYPPTACPLNAQGCRLPRRAQGAPRALLSPVLWAMVTVPLPASLLPSHHPPGWPHQLPPCCPYRLTCTGVRTPRAATGFGRRAHSPKVSGVWPSLGVPGPQVHLLQPLGRSHSHQAPGQHVVVAPSARRG